MTGEPEKKPASFAELSTDKLAQLFDQVQAGKAPKSWKAIIQRELASREKAKLRQEMRDIKSLFPAADSVAARRALYVRFDVCLDKMRRMGWRFPEALGVIAYPAPPLPGEEDP